MKIFNLKTFLLGQVRLHISIVFTVFLGSSVYYLCSGLTNIPVIISFFLWHLSVYLINKTYDVREDNYMSKGAISSDAKRVYFIFSFLCLLSPILILFFSGNNLLIYLLFMPLGVLYSMPIMDFRIKSLFLIKNIYAAGATVMVPAVVLVKYYSYSGTLINLFLGYVSYFFLLFFVIEIISDIPDREADEKFGIKTIPNTYKFSLVKKLLTFIILISGGIGIVVDNLFLLVIPMYLLITTLVTTERNINKMIAYAFYGFLLLFLVLTVSGKLFTHLIVY